MSESPRRALGSEESQAGGMMLPASVTLWASQAELLGWYYKLIPIKTVKQIEVPGDTAEIGYSEHKVK